MNDASVRGARSLSLSIVSRLRRFAFIFQWLRGGGPGPKFASLDPRNTPSQAVWKFWSMTIAPSLPRP